MMYHRSCCYHHQPHRPRVVEDAARTIKSCVTSAVTGTKTQPGVTVGQNMFTLLICWTCDTVSYLLGTLDTYTVDFYNRLISIITICNCLYIISVTGHTHTHTRTLMITINGNKPFVTRWLYYDKRKQAFRNSLVVYPVGQVSIFFFSF